MLKDPRLAWRLGLPIAGLGLVVSVVMLLVTDGAARAPWQLGMLGFGSLALVCAAGLWISRR